MGTIRTSDAARGERDLRERALRDAASLYAEHGRRAIDLLASRLIDPSRTAPERRCDRLTLLATERIDRDKRQSGGSMALVAWKPPLFSLAGLAALFGLKRGRRR